MKLIDPNTLAFDNSHYRKKLLICLSNNLDYLLRYLLVEDGNIRFNKDQFSMSVLIEHDNPIDKESLRKIFDRVLETDYYGCMGVGSMKRSQHTGDIFKVKINITDPYKLLYHMFHKGFKKVLVDFLNIHIERIVVHSTTKHFDFKIFCNSPGRTNHPLEYLNKMLQEIVEENSIYRLHYGSYKKNRYIPCRISWGKEEDEVESQPSCLNRIKEYVKKLVKC